MQGGEQPNLPIVSIDTNKMMGNFGWSGKNATSCKGKMLWGKSTAEDFLKNK